MNKITHCKSGLLHLDPISLKLATGLEIMVNLRENKTLNKTDLLRLTKKNVLRVASPVLYTIHGKIQPQFQCPRNLWKINRLGFI